MASVRVRVVEAKGLSAVDAQFPGAKASTSDPYAEVFVGDLYWRTSHKTKELDPKWDEEALFEVGTSSEAVHVLLWDWNQFNAHVFLGEVLIDLCDLVRRGDVIDDWFVLQKPDMIKTGVSGEVQLQIMLEDTYATERGLGWSPDASADRVVELPPGATRPGSSVAEHRQGTQHGIMDGAVTGKIEKVRTPLGKLQLRLLAAERLIAMDSPDSGKIEASSDPYVDVHLEGSYWRSETVQKSCNPRWSKADAEIPFTSFDSLLHILIFDHDAFSSDDYLGEILLPVGYLRFEGKEESITLKVQAPPGHASPITGHVHLKIRMADVSEGHNNWRAPTSEERSAARSSATFTPAMARGIPAAVDPSDAPSSPLSPNSRRVRSASAASSASRADATRPLTSYEDERGLVHRGMYWRGIHARGQRVSAFDLAQTPERSVIEGWMAKNRERGFKIMSLQEGPGEREEIARISSSAARFNLRVKLLSGQELMVADDTGFSDPYCDIAVLCPKSDEQSCKHTWRSACKMQTLNPEWHEQRQVPLLSKNAVLHVVCHDWDRMFSDDFLGESLVDLTKYADGEEHTLRLELDQFDSKTKTEDDVKGYITIQLQLTRSRRL